MPLTHLVERPLDATLFRGVPGALGGVVTAAAFLHDAHALARALPDAAHLVNLCRDRYAFTVAFAAALLRGQACLVPGDASAARLAALGVQFPASTAAVDRPDPTIPLPCSVVRPTGAGASTDNPVLPSGRLAAIVFTSGSTGTPVAHRKAWGALAARSRAAAGAFGMAASAPPSVVGTVPPGHMYGFEATVLLPLHAPASSWCGPAFYPGDVAAALAAVPGPRVLVTTPLHLRALLAVDAALPPLGAIISATTPLDAVLAAGAEAAWGAPVLEIFGATEVGSIAHRRATDGDWWTAYPGVSIASNEAETTVTAPWADPTPLADEVALDGGRFRLLGRRADLVKMGGQRASLSGLTQILLGLDGVADGAFVAPDDLGQRTGARLLAVVVAPRRSAGDILADLRGRMDPLFLPRRVLCVDALPRNELGKLPRQALLALLNQ